MADQVVSASLRMAWSRTPWDEAVCDFPVLQITEMQILGTDAGRDLRAVEQARDELGAGLVSCRLSHEYLRESMLLEDHGFRFIEMVYQPEITLSRLPDGANDTELSVSPASDDDMPFLLEIARTAFRNERFSVDPRIAPDVSDKRYQNWVTSSQRHVSQTLHVIREGERKIAFFVTEMLADGTCYWHLNALAPSEQGKGLGRRVWLSMLGQAVGNGARRVVTSIVVRNHRVLNLYASLRFRFPAPLMTFHWVRANTDAAANSRVIA